jgi:hypothetical protein
LYERIIFILSFALEIITHDKMKKILICVFSLLVINTAYGQGNFEKGANVLSLGLGFGSSLGGGYSYGSQTPGISVQFEHGMWEVGGPGVISLGGYLGYKSFGYDYSIYNQTWKYTIVGLRSAYHYNGIRSEDWDVFGGAMLSFNILSYDDNDPGFDYNASSGLFFTVYVGGRYYFTPSVAAFAELGYGISYLNLGVAFKF